MWKKVKTSKESGGSVPHCTNVATTLEMGCQVTPWSIAYAAAQVCVCEHVLMELILILSCSFTSHSRLLPSGARSTMDLIIRPFTGFLSITLKVGLQMLRSSSTGGMSKYLTTLLDLSLTPPYRQIFPNATPPQGPLTYSSMEASMALLMEQEETGSSGGSDQ